MLADLVDLRLALGIAKWNLLSLDNSGMALQLLRADPDGIRSLVLDSVIPPQTDSLAGQALSSQTALNLLFQRCGEYERCRLAFPEVEKTFYEVADTLKARPILVSPYGDQATQVYVNGDRFVQAVLGVLGFSSQPDTAEELPKMIYEMKAGKDSLFSKLLGNAQYNLVDFGSAVNWFQFCNENLRGRSADEIIRAMGKVEPQLNDAFRFSISQAVEVCSAWQVTGFQPAVSAQPVKSSVPALLLAGDYNPYAAPDWSDLAAKTLNQATVVKFTGVGAYSAFSGRWGSCASVIMTAFVEDPSSPPPASCSMEEISFLFVTLPEFDTP